MRHTIELVTRQPEGWAFTQKKDIPRMQANSTYCYSNMKHWIRIFWWIFSEDIRRMQANSIYCYSNMKHWIRIFWWFWSEDIPRMKVNSIYCDSNMKHWIRIIWWFLSEDFPRRMQVNSIYFGSTMKHIFMNLIKSFSTDAGEFNLFWFYYETFDKDIWWFLSATVGHAILNLRESVLTQIQL
jgi:hypothetical protein